MPKDNSAAPSAVFPVSPSTVFQTVEITAAMAHLIPPLLYRGFGYTYTDHSLYTEEGVAAVLAGGRTRFFAALDAPPERGGRAVAMMAMRFCYPSRDIAELGLLLVDPAVPAAAAGQLLRLLTGCIVEAVRTLAATEGLRALASTEVTVHSLTQRLVGTFDFTTTGIYLGWTPAWGEHLRLLPSDRLSGSGHSREAQRVQRLMSQRRTETVSVRPFPSRIAPYAVAPPTRFAPLLRALYDGLKLPVTFTAAEPAAAHDSTVAHESTVDVRLDLRRSLAVIEAVTVGADAVPAVLDRFIHARDGMIDVIHVVLPLNRVDIDPLVTALLNLGCVWGALIPFYRGHDVIVLQYLNGVDVELEMPDLHSPLARRILTEIRSDEAAHHTHGGGA